MRTQCVRLPLAAPLRFSRRMKIVLSATWFVFFVSLGLHSLMLFWHRARLSLHLHTQSPGLLAPCAPLFASFSCYFDIANAMRRCPLPANTIYLLNIYGYGCGTLAMVNPFGSYIQSSSRRCRCLPSSVLIRHRLFIFASFLLSLLFFFFLIGCSRPATQFWPPRPHGY